MKLYHGTTEKVALQALQVGLEPREVSGVLGNWEHTISSSPDRVYLTEAYAPYFAFCAGNAGEKLAIIEIDTEDLIEVNFLPDEDFLEQIYRVGYDFCLPVDIRILLGRIDMGARTEWFRNNTRQFQKMWEQSVRVLSTCSYEGIIPVNALTGCVVFVPESNPLVSQMAIDPQISIFNYALMGDKYRNLTRWFFEQGVTAREVVGQVCGLGMPVEYLVQINAKLKDRSALERLW